MKQVAISIPTFADLLDYVEANSPLSKATRTDYAAAITRSLALYGVVRLEDIPADLQAFERRFRLTGFDPTCFATEAAYQAWRRKVIASIKGFLGLLKVERDRRGRNDGWATLAAVAGRFIADHPTFDGRRLIALSILTDEARIAQVEPHELTADRLAAIGASTHAQRQVCLRRGAQLLDDLREVSDAVARLLPPDPLGRVLQARRSAPRPAPRHLLDEAESWIMDHCGGQYDPIQETYEDARSDSTIDHYQSAFRKYLSEAEHLGLLEGVLTLADALRPDIFIQAVRAWIEETDEARRISDSSKQQYVTDIRRLALRNGVDVTVIDQSLWRNRRLSEGARVAQEMSAEAKRFCAWLLSDRHQSLLFQSLHVHFETKCLNLLKQEREDRLPPADAQKILQLGALAALSAVALWGAPLRIGNLSALTIHGASPWLLLPTGRRADVKILIPRKHTKQKRNDIRQDLRQGPHRAVEVLQWYVRVVRPRFPGADKSPFLVPGKVEGAPVSTGAVRNWLGTHGRQVGIAMKPHWFRHGIASLYIRRHPGGYTHVAQLLDDTPDVVRRYYAWIDDEAQLLEVQHSLLKIAGF